MFACVCDLVFHGHCFWVFCTPGQGLFYYQLHSCIVLWWPRLQFGDCKYRFPDAVPLGVVLHTTTKGHEDNPVWLNTSTEYIIQEGDEVGSSYIVMSETYHWRGRKSASAKRESRQGKLRGRT